MLVITIYCTIHIMKLNFHAEIFEKQSFTHYAVSAHSCSDKVQLCYIKTKKLEANLIGNIVDDNNAMSTTIVT